MTGEVAALLDRKGLKLGHYVGEFTTPGIGYIMKEAGADFVFFDMEHSGNSFETVQRCLRYFEAADMPVFTRVPSDRSDHIARALDAGADAIVIPMVGSAKQARSVLEKMKYTPIGKRGLALALANDRYRMQPVSQALAAANARTRFVALIETAEGIENVDEIAAVDGVDVLWVGHLDLTASMGIPGQFDHPDYKKALAKVLKAGQKHGLGLGRMVGDIPSGVGLAEEGWDLIAYNGDVWLLQNALRQGIDGIRSGYADVAKAAKKGAAKKTKKKAKEADDVATFEVALSGDFRLPDGGAAYPSFDLGPLQANPDVRVRYVDPVDGVMPAAALEDVDALILLVPRFDATSVPKSGRLAVVARFGVGFDSVDVPVCTANDIALVTTPDGVRRPVAVAILTFILALAGRLMVKDQLVRQGPEGWAKRSANMGMGLVGRTLGQLGIGNIGAEVFRIARPLDMRFIAFDPYADATVAATLGVELVDLETLFRESDFLSVSCPLNEQTRHIVNAERLALMKPTSFIINTARGPVVDQRALHETLKAKRIAGAGLDVFEVEPTPEGEPITTLDNVILAPHSLCWTDECFAGIGAADVAAVLAMMQGRVPRGIVNREITERAGWQAKLAALGKSFTG